MTVPNEVIRRAAADVSFFAQQLIGEALFEHQIALATDPARIRSVLAGRQSGKTRTLSVVSLHEGFRAPGRRVLILSAGESAANELLAEVSALAASPLLAGSVIDENASTVRLSNGSTIRALPASQKQVRGRSVDLLILDEACFIDDALWTAARFCVIARPESRVILSSTPWGRRDKFFATAYRAGQAKVEGYSSHHWPSTISPLVDDEILAIFAETMSDREYRSEILGEWCDEQGAYYTSDELAAGVALGGPDGSQLIDPAMASWVDNSWGRRQSFRHLEVDAGLDWGFAHDSSTVVCVADVPQHFSFYAPGRLWIPYLAEAVGVPYERWIDQVIALGRHPRGMRFRSMSPETNGVGQMPAQMLRRLATETGVCSAVEGVHTDTKVKESGYGAVKMALQSERFVLPQHPGLLRQLASLEFEQLDGGSLRLAVPERLGHDDLVSGLMLAMQPRVAAAEEWQQRRPISVTNRDWTRGARF